MLLDFCLRVWSFFGQAAVPSTDITAPAAAAEPVVMKFNWVRYILMVLYLLVCVGLTTVVMNTEQKSGGLQGMLGGGGDSVAEHKYQGKKSFEENLKTAGNYLAIAFIGLSILVSYVMQSPAK